MSAESRARRKIRQAVEAKGYAIERFDWEPIRPGAEKEGPTGGWYLEVRSPSGGMDWVGGLNWQDAVEYAEKWLETVLSVSARLEQQLAAVKRDPETAARLLLDMGEALRLQHTQECGTGYCGNDLEHCERARSLLSRLDALGKGTA